MQDGSRSLRRPSFEDQAFLQPGTRVDVETIVDSNGDVSVGTANVLVPVTDGGSFASYEVTQRAHTPLAKLPSAASPEMLIAIVFNSMVRLDKRCPEARVGREATVERGSKGEG